MIIKESFTLLKGVSNILHLSSSDIKNYSVENGNRKLFVMLELHKNRIKHYAKDSIFPLISNLEKRKKISTVNIPDYNLHVSYNQPTKQMIFNISPYNVDDFSMIDSKNLYSQMVYCISFFNLVTGVKEIKTSSFSIISNYLLSMFIGVFGKEYGLLGSYSNNITGLNFLINCYILSSFFGITGNKSYKMSSVVSNFNYKEIEKDLDNYDFSNIENFIRSLSDFKIMSGFNKYLFTGKMLKIAGVSFLPALEDLSRFISICSCIAVKGSNIVPTYLSKYNEDSFGRIIDISKTIFK